MLLNLRKIIEAPGEIPFSFEMDLSELDFDSVSSFLTPLRAKGRVVNSAGVLTMNAEIEIGLRRVCDRCSVTYETTQKIDTSVVLEKELQDEENPDVFLLDGDNADLDEIIRTLFILDMDMKSLCRDDCKGICFKCGKNLNEGPCDCKPETDPRLAVLGQLLNE
jgi:uncharacterized protein